MDPDKDFWIVWPTIILSDLAHSISLPENRALDKQDKNVSDYTISEFSKRNRRKAYETWSDEEDDLLKKQFKKINNIEQLSKIFHRSPGAIKSRIKKLGLRSEGKTRMKAYE